MMQGQAAFLLLAISVAAAALCMEIQYLSTGTIDLSWDYSAFIFFGTLSLYNAHRYISFNRSRLIGNTDRFKIVAELGVWVPVLVIVSVLSALLYGYPYARQQGRRCRRSRSAVDGQLPGKYFLFH